MTVRELIHILTVLPSDSRILTDTGPDEWGIPTDSDISHLQEDGELVVIYA